MSSEYLMLVCTWCLSFYFDNSSIRWLGGHLMLFQPTEYRLLEKNVRCYLAVSIAECCWTLHRRFILPSKSDVNLFLYLFLSSVQTVFFKCANWRKRLHSLHTTFDPNTVYELNAKATIWNREMKLCIERPCFILNVMSWKLGGETPITSPLRLA